MASSKNRVEQQGNRNKIKLFTRSLLVWQKPATDLSWFTSRYHCEMHNSTYNNIVDDDVRVMMKKVATINIVIEFVVRQVNSHLILLTMNSRNCVLLIRTPGGNAHPSIIYSQKKEYIINK